VGGGRGGGEEGAGSGDGDGLFNYGAGGSDGDGLLNYGRGGRNGNGVWRYGISGHQSFSLNNGGAAVDENCATNVSDTRGGTAGGRRRGARACGWATGGEGEGSGCALEVREGPLTGVGGAAIGVDEHALAAV